MLQANIAIRTMARRCAASGPATGCRRAGAAKDSRQEVAKAAPVATRVRSRAGHDPGQHHEDECRLVEANAGIAEAAPNPTPSNARHGEAHAAQGLVGVRGASAGAHAPPWSATRRRR